MSFSPEFYMQSVPLTERRKGEEGPPGEGASSQLAQATTPRGVGAVFATEAPISQVRAPGVALAQLGVRPTAIFPLVDFAVAT
ncbi:hypothetical protein CDAR_28411 [Caerostris darwini]|uniref:Uncharacterized protein n=1 Tax=Caerostris darwini TaxID=1538125 RepID=A0AAV4Q0E5_9ARAC|nr:hypothetical protein CDAR_28411 [Caerostris darwini]